MSRSYGMPIRTREKRTAKISVYVPPSLKAYYQAKVDHPSKSESDVVFEALEKQAAIEIAQQKLSGRVGRN